MKTAVISDIHANLEALRVVLDHIDSQNVDRIICLGDILGYGPSPVECVDIVAERCEWSLMGNHDFAVLFEPTAFNTSAETSAFWTRRQLELETDPEKRRRRWEYLGNLRIREQNGSISWYHASPRRPINEYIFPDDVITAPTKMTQIFDRIDANSDGFIDEISLIGPVERIRERLAAWRESPITTITLGGADSELMRTMAELVEA